MCLSVVIADDEAITRKDLKERLELNGYNVVGEAMDGFDAVELCREKKPDFVLLDIRMPLLDGLGAAKIIHDEELSGCIIMITAYTDDKYIEKANDIGVMGYIVKPFQDSTVFPNIEIAIKRSKELSNLKEQLVNEKKKLRERKIIEQAKGIIMEQNSLNEKEAYEYIRMLSMNKRKSMGSIAEIIVSNDRFLKE
ncbi:MAG: ANTAR domain-containing response regulator [Anaerovoracaceae bacterium]